MVAAPAGTVVVIHGPATPTSENHEREAQRHVAERLARLKGYAFGGVFDADAHYAGALYFVPAGTLLAAEAAQLGIHSIDNLFGGVVGAPVIATKCITHPLFDPEATAPEGWCDAFADQVRDVVLPGFSAFGREAALRAGEALLRGGPVRLKPGEGVGGRGQLVVNNPAELSAALEQLDLETLAANGVVLERNLEEVVTFSVGQITLGELRITYIGTQATTDHPGGGSAYGGSELLVMRGDFDAALAAVTDRSLRSAVERAQHYDRVAAATLPDFLASRRNYDVVTGADASGATVSGVLEQSWRIGGASPAEIAALEAFAANPELDRIWAASYERYGAHTPPADATLAYDGDDGKGNRLVKYSRVWSDADPA